MLKACVWAMADEFHDLSFSRIPDHEPMGIEPCLLSFFCDVARHWWARLSQGEEVTPASYTSAAIRCPFGEALIIALALHFEESRSPLEPRRSQNSP